MEEAAPTRPLPIGRIVAPRSVAVIGASEDVGKFGGRVIHYLIRHGFPGTLLPINPNRATIRGLPAWPRVSDAPLAPDVAILAVPAATLEAQIADCAKAGVGACIVITGKLAEAGPEGAALQDRVVAMARGAGMRILGPNCLGIFNPVDRAMLSSSLALEEPDFAPGGIGLVSQSGALMGTLLSFGRHHGARFSRCISVGNQADLTLEDFLAYLLEDEATRTIGLYVEGLRDAPRFRALLKAARVAGKPVFAVKAGRSEAGAKAARSHTASLAGAFPVFEAICREAGAVVLDDPQAMILACDAAIRLPPWPAAGLGLAPIASSGGSTVTFADMMPAFGLRLAEMAPATCAVLGDWMPESHVALPVDTGSFHEGTRGDGLAACIRAFMADPDVGAVAVPMTTQPDMAGRTALFPPLAREGGKPLLYVMTAGAVGDASRAVMRAADFPFYDRMADALAVARALDAEAAGRARAQAAMPARPEGAGPPPALSAGPLTEGEAKRLLAAYGIPVTREATVADADAAAAAARAIGYPVVLKGVSRAVVHKSDLGLVRLGLAEEEALRMAFAEVTQALDRAAPGAGEGCVVQEMARGEAELFLGAMHDAQFGPMVMVGAGGVLVEFLQDVRMAPAPLAAGDARALIEGLRMAPLLRGLRGRPAADLAAAADALVRLSWLAADLGPRIAELDVNPLILRAEGQGAIAVDARATIAEEDAS
ncbi:acetate--CoA ligase family protein [Roseomonas alkaliterrae]|uniref:Acetyl-CoA synthetase (ADP-forming) n=1 Tax=Neoroseomonas alkaliterrae TaxID=1452450 RepID=A0A840XU73_9PROT|nr:acetate--CoA ligase family protein [Neoroseomonas alkaliterrae]MBB5690199.1 acetyl-CoA synthetase (ADP-forming) [Neoroseomonas alkaliterrae]MBR0674787.1 acetate--CoA ligase family protein [Neoroseomonas alkaliterrae]